MQLIRFKLKRSATGLRRWTLFGMCFVISGLTVSGCQSPLDEYKPWSSSSSLNRVTEPDRRTATSQPIATQGTDTSISLREDSGPEQYVSIALKRNPAIRSARRRIRRYAARIPQATSLDDPMLQVAPFGDMPETAAGQVGLMTGVSQKLPFPGKLSTWGKIAQQDVAMTKQRLRQAQLRVAADVRRAYWTYYLAARSIEVTKVNRRLLRQFRQTVRAKYQAGTASQSDVLRATTELSELENKLSTLDQRRQTAEAMLNRLMDRPVHRSLPTPKRVPFEPTKLQLKQLLRQAEANNPEIARVRERIDKFRARRKLANLNRWPDLTVSANYNAVEDEGLSPVTTGEDAWWLGFGINVPIWRDKLDAAEREAVQGRLEASADLEAKQNAIAFRVRDALARFRTQQEQVALFKNTILPRAEQTVRASMSSYRTGEDDFLTVIDNWGKLLQFDLAYHQSLAQLEQDFADLQQQVGENLTRHRQPAATQPMTRPDTQPNQNIDAKPPGATGEPQ